MNTTNAVAVWTRSELPSVTTKGGTTTYLSKKAYGSQFNLNGRKLDRAHDSYREQRAMENNAAFAGAIARGEVLIEKNQPTKDGGKLKWTFRSELGNLGATVDKKKATRRMERAARALHDVSIWSDKRGPLKAEWEEARDQYVKAYKTAYPSHIVMYS